MKNPIKKLENKIHTSIKKIHIKKSKKRRNANKIKTNPSLNPKP
jgi:hypothetical protein